MCYVWLRFPGAALASILTPVNAGLHILTASATSCLAAGPDEVPQVRELGSAPGGQAGSGAAGQVEADGRGGLPGAAVLPFHQPHSQTLRCGTTATGR